MPRFLIVEDDRVSGKLMMGLLKRYGDCDLAIDGAQAMQFFYKSYEEKQPYDVVFLDIMIPFKSGQEVLNEIRDYEVANSIPPPNTLKAVMTSALDDTENVLSAHISGCCGYLVKPLRREDLEQVLTSVGVSVNQAHNSSI